MKKTNIVMVTWAVIAGIMLCGCQSAKADQQTPGTVDVIEAIEYNDWSGEKMAVITFEYDDHGLPTGKAVPEIIERPSRDTYVFENTGDGMTVSVYDEPQDQVPDTIWTLDDQGYVIKEEKTDHYTCDYTYDEDGRQLSKHFEWKAWETEAPVSTDLCFQYDDKGRLLKIENSATGQIQSFEYNNEGQIISEDNTYNTESLLGYGGFEYNNEGQLTHMEMYYYEDLDEYDYTYDDHGNIISDGPVVYHYKTIEIKPEDHVRAVNVQRLIHPAGYDLMFNGFDPLVFD